MRLRLRTVTVAVATVMVCATTASNVTAGESPDAMPYDFNGDGYADLVIGSPGESLGTATQAGMFHILYGSATGPKAVGSRAIHQDTPGVPGTAESDDNFGSSTTSGDFNGDGYADLAVSASTEKLGDNPWLAGAVWIFQGSARGLRTDTVKSVNLNDTGLTTEWLSRFGHDLAAGDFNGDGRDDLAISAPLYGYQPTGGHVFIGYGTADGVDLDLQKFTQDTPGIPGVDESPDLFGFSLAVGDINGDARDDLAIGTPYDSEDRDYPTGSVTVLYGHRTGLTARGAQHWSQDTPGVPGGDLPDFASAAEQSVSQPSLIGPLTHDEDEPLPNTFGFDVALADFSGDGKADLAVGAPGTPLLVDGQRREEPGTVTVLYSDGTALSTANAVEITRGTLSIPSRIGGRERFGYTLASGDANGDHRYELAITSLGDEVVTVTAGADDGLVFGGTQVWTQDSPGVPGIGETHDLWGLHLQFADVTGAGREALIVGVPGENGLRGACTVIRGSATGLTGTGATAFSQDTYGIAGTAESGDRFGTF